MFVKQRKAFPGEPDFCAEFWVGWFDAWDRPRGFPPAHMMTRDLAWMMKNGASFSLYMFHGGSTRGLWSGANRDKTYLPTTDCYDYQAPLDESGRPTLKYQQIRDIIQNELSGVSLPAIPRLPAPGSIGEIQLTEQCRLLDALPEGKTSDTLQTMEDLGQITGFLLYRTSVDGPLEGELALGDVKDRVHVILDGQVIGISGRSTKGAAISVKLSTGTHKLDLLVENMGRVNYGKQMNQERKGLDKPIMLAGKELGPFEHVGLPLQAPPGGSYQEIKEGANRSGITLYRGTVKSATPRDTWLDMRGFGRGIVWFNGRNLGRYWKKGPPQSVFLPACWMEREKENELVILELEAETCPKKVPTSAEAIWGDGN
jgi:beta-galactosidase